MRYLQNRIATSRRSLPITAIYGLAVCIAGGLISKQLWVEFAMLLASTLLMAALNNSNALIRIFSRMVSCSFLVLTTMSLFLFRNFGVDLVQFAFIGFLFFLLKANQQPRAVEQIFCAFMFLGIGSIEFAQILLFVPLLWIVIAAKMMAFNSRTFIASLLGITLPYWFLTAWLFYTNNLGFLPTHLLDIVRFQPLGDFSAIGLHQWLCFAFVALLALIGSVHFIAYSYQDRIRIRMIYEMFIVLLIFCFLFALLQPQHFNYLLGMAIVLTAPLIGHWLALTNSRLSNITSFILAGIAFALTCFNLVWLH